MSRCQSSGWTTQDALWTPGYRQLLPLAAEADEAEVAAALGKLLCTEQPPLAETLRPRLLAPTPPTVFVLFIPDLAAYD